MKYFSQSVEVLFLQVLMKITLNPIKEVFITNFIKLDIQNMAKVKAVNALTKKFFSNTSAVDIEINP